MDPKTDAGLAFLFEKQIEEADLACFSKTDRYSEFPPLPGFAAVPQFANRGRRIGVAGRYPRRRSFSRREDPRNRL
jgi:G3E family GTPase